MILSMTDKPTPEEIADFHRAVAGARPLNAVAYAAIERKKPHARPRRHECEDTTVATSTGASFEVDEREDSDAFLRTGVRRAVLRDLRRGRWTVERHLDLHGLNRYEAHDALTAFIDASIQSAKRCVRVVHGLGNGSPGRQGVLRPLVKSWLIRNSGVLAFCHAPLSDGGKGVLWILLRSSDKTRG